MATISTGRRLFLLPQVIDSFILSEFFFYLIVLLASFVLLTEVFNFFELLGDVFRNQIPIRKLLLVPVLPDAEADLRRRAGECTGGRAGDFRNAHKEQRNYGAQGVRGEPLPAIDADTDRLWRDERRRCLPSITMSIPEANLIQDALRNEIKGRAVQTYLNPNRKWIFGRGSRIYYYKLFDPNEDILGGVSVYQLDPQTFRLTRQVSRGTRALGTETEDVDFSERVGARVSVRTRQLQTFPNQTATFAELDESPAYFGPK